MADQTKSPLQKPPGFGPPNGQTYFPPAGKPAKPQTYRARKKPRKWCRVCCCYTSIILLILIVLAGSITCVLYLWYDPKMPVVRLQSLEFPLLNMTGDSDESKIRIQTVARMEVKNPNNVLTLHFEKTEVTLKVGEYDLGTATLPAFDQEKRKTNVMKLEMPEKELTMDTMTAKKFVDGIKSKSVMFGTVVKTAVGASADGWTTSRPSVKAHCGGLTMRAIQGGAVPKCKITVFEVVHIDT